MPEHVCHATGCSVAVPPKMFMCKTHWYMVPRPIRNEIWAAYRPGQEQDKNPSREYLEIARKAIAAVAQKEIPSGGAD